MLDLGVIVELLKDLAPCGSTEASLVRLKSAFFSGFSGCHLFNFCRDCVGELELGERGLQMVGSFGLPLLCLLEASILEGTGFAPADCPRPAMVRAWLDVCRPVLSGMLILD